MVNKHLCTNPQCDYGGRGLACEAYSQDEKAWAAGTPHYGGLCLNCWDDLERGREFMRVEAELDEADAFRAALASNTEQGK